MRNLMEKKLRKRQSMLVDAGMAVILFAVWSVARVNLYLGHATFILEELYRTAEEFGINKNNFLIFMVSFVAVILLFQLSIRLYIGICATKEGKGTSKGWAYLVLTAVLLIIDTQSYWQTFGVQRIFAGEGLSVNLISGLCMEAASIYVLLELLISGICVKKLRTTMKV